MKTRAALHALALAAVLSAGAAAQGPAYAPRTGDIWLDAELGTINEFGARERVALVDEIVRGFGAPRFLVNQLLEAKHWPAGDVYYACALAYQAQRPCSDAVHAFEQDKGGDWAAVAAGLGLKPGSAGLRELKARLAASHARHQAPAPAK